MFIRFFALFKARMLEYCRDKGALIWSLMFPLLLVVGFGVMFSGGQSALYKMGVVGDVSAQDSPLYETKFIQFVEYEKQEKALLKLSQHSLDLLVDFSLKQYWINTDSPKGYIAEKLLLQSEPEFVKTEHVGKQIRYVDWVVPGILGMNIMFGCFFGVGYAIVRYRKYSVLKRLHATPISALEFLLAQVASRLVIVLVTVSIVYSLSNLLFDFYMIGNYLRLIFVVLLGSLALISLSLIIASRWESEELTNGILNLASWPMMILSGVWFSLEGTPEFVQSFANLFPLTHMLTSMREIMFNDADLWQLRYHLGALGLMTVIFLSISARLFRWHGSGR